MTEEPGFRLQFENFFAYSPKDLIRLTTVDLPLLNDHFLDGSLKKFLDKDGSKN